MKTYDHYFSLWWRSFYEIWNRIQELKLLRPHLEKIIISNGKVVDIGCGDMYLFSKGFLPKPSSYFGIEPSTSLINIAQKNNPDLELTRASGDMTPFPNNFADMTLCLWVLHIAESISGIIHECIRITRPGGKILIAIPASNSQLYESIYACAKKIYPWQKIIHPNELINECLNILFSELKGMKINPKFYACEVLLPFNSKERIFPLSVFFHWILDNSCSLYEISMQLKDNINCLDMLPEILEDKGALIEATII